MTTVKHPVAIYCGSPKNRHRWHAAIVIESWTGRIVLWQSEEIYPSHESAQEAAKAHDEATST